MTTADIKNIIINHNGENIVMYGKYLCLSWTYNDKKLFTDCRLTININNLGKCFNIDSGDKIFFIPLSPNGFNTFDKVLIDTYKIDANEYSKIMKNYYHDYHDNAHNYKNDTKNNKDDKGKKGNGNNVYLNYLSNVIDFYSTRENAANAFGLDYTRCENHHFKQINKLLKEQIDQKYYLGFDLTIEDATLMNLIKFDKLDAIKIELVALNNIMKIYES